MQNDRSTNVIRMPHLVKRESEKPAATTTVANEYHLMQRQDAKSVVFDEARKIAYAEVAKFKDGTLEEFTARIFEVCEEINAGQPGFLMVPIAQSIAKWTWEKFHEAERLRGMRKSKPVRTKSEWRPIGSAPKDGRLVILKIEHRGTEQVFLGYWGARHGVPDGWCIGCPWSSRKTLAGIEEQTPVTHWAPIPELRRKELRQLARARVRGKREAKSC